MAVAANTGSMIGSRYATTMTMTIPTKVTEVINQLLENQASIMQQTAEISFSSQPLIAVPAFNMPPIQMCQSLPSRHFRAGSSTRAQEMHTAAVDVGEPVVEDVADARDADSICLPTTWLILAMGWDSCYNTVEASLEQHYLEICLLHSRACSVVNCHIPISTNITIPGTFLLHVALTWLMATLPSCAFSER